MTRTATKSVAKRALLACALVLVAGSVAVGDDEAWEKQAKAEIAYFKKHSKRARDDQTYADLLMAVASTEHPIAAKYLGDLILRDKDLEHQMIAAAALQDFRRGEESRLAAGEAAMRALVKGKKLEIDVKDSLVDTLGKLKFEPAVEPICEILKKGGDPYFLVTCVRALGRIGSLKALPQLLQLWERSPVGYSWETGEVSVDTGAAGTADQDAAEAQWKAKYGNAGPKGKPPMMMKFYIQELAQAVAKIVGEKLKGPSELRAWMEAREEELAEAGIEIPRRVGPSKKPKKKDEDEDKNDDGDGDDK